MSQSLQSSGGSFVFILYCWWKMSERSLQQRIKFCVKIGKIVSEMLILLKPACVEHNIICIFEWHRQLKEGSED